MNHKPFSQACENNKRPILEVLREHLQEPGRLLEIGSGTGQHATWLPRFLPHVHWQPSDVQAHLPGIRAWLADAPANVAPPLELDVNGAWPAGPWDYLFSANTLHIMSLATARRCLEQGAQSLAPGGMFLIYGPFNYGGRYTSDSNASFDLWLKERDPASGIRDAEWVEETLGRSDVTPVADHAMPANNRLLVWRRSP